MAIALSRCPKLHFLTINCARFLYFSAKNLATGEAYMGHSGVRSAPRGVKGKFR